jgi:signal transduction histidine kinase
MVSFDERTTIGDRAVMDGGKALQQQDVAALAADRARLELALAAAGNVGVWDGDLVAGLVYGDANFARIYSVDPVAAAAGQPLGHYFAIIHPGDRDAARAEMQALISGQKAEFYHEHRICWPDGTTRWVLARGRLVLDAAGRPVRLPGLSLDITDRRNAEARQTFLLALLDGLRALEDPVAMLDIAVSSLGEHLGVSRAGYGDVEPGQQTMRVISGYADGVPSLNQCFQMDEFGRGNAARLRQGLSVVQNDVSSDPDNATDTFRRLGTRGMISAPLLREGMLRATLWVASTAPRDWEPGEVRLVEDVGARLWEVLERARAERALRDANAALEERIEAAVRARDRVEDALRQAQKMEAIGQLTGGIAHDFNNMLQGISGAVELMRRRIAAGKSEQALVFADAAQAGIDRAAALTRRLLAFSRRQVLAPQRVDVADLVQEMAAMIQQTVGPSIRVQLCLAAPCWAVECDPNQLENALLNLAINARDAMLPGGGTVVIETEQAGLFAPGAAAQPGAAPGNFVRLTVRDHGQGMPADIMARACEPFFTTKPAGQGTGLGLSQVYGFVEQSKGVVRLESAVGEGTSVHLFLPRHVDDASETATGPAVACGSAG